MTDILMQIAEERQTHDSPTRLRLLLEKAWQFAEEGEIAALRLVLAYIQPEPKERENSEPALPFIVQGLTFIEAQPPEAEE